MKPTFPHFLGRYAFLLLPLLSFAQGITKANDKVHLAAYVPDPSKSIIKNAEVSENLQELLKLLRATNLDEVLDYDGQFTVFAPSNSAFGALESLQDHSLLDPSNKKVLRDIVGYHIVAGNFSASRILQALCQGEGQTSLTTIQGETLDVAMQGTDILLIDKLGNTAKITTADVKQCNGVVHEIDSVFFPTQI